MSFYGSGCSKLSQDHFWILLLHSTYTGFSCVVVQLSISPLPRIWSESLPNCMWFTFQSTQTLALTQRAGQNLQIYLPLMHLHSIPSMHRHFYKTSSSTLSLKAAPLTVPLSSSWTQQAFHTILALCVSGHVSLRLWSACWSGHILALGLGDSKCHINAPLANVSNPGIRKARVLHQSWGEMWLCSAHTKMSRDDALNVSPFPGQHHYPSSPSNWQRGFGWPLAFKNQNHCSLQVCTCYYLCLQKWKSLDLLYLPCTCHSHLAHSHQGTAVYIIRWKKIYKVWSDLWDPILRFKVRFGPDQVCSRSGPRWTPNRTPFGTRPRHRYLSQSPEL